MERMVVYGIIVFLLGVILYVASWNMNYGQPTFPLLYQLQSIFILMVPTGLIMVFLGIVNKKPSFQPKLKFRSKSSPRVKSRRKIKKKKKR